MTKPNGKPRTERRQLLVSHEKLTGRGMHRITIVADIRAAIFISDALKELETKHAYRLLNTSDPLASVVHRPRKKKNGAVPEENLRAVADKT